MAASLATAGIDYKQQHVIPQVGISDFYLPTMHTVIFCDGDYWHTLPGKPEHDAKQTAAAQRRGYRVLRFWGSEIKADPAECVRRIQRQAA